MRLIWISLFLFFPIFNGNGLLANATPTFPSGPNAKLTPGAICDHPTSYRYPEHIAYCNRNVSGGTKAGVIKEYDTVLGYKIQSMNRADFKIDHLIPLCMGGDNDEDNLWPQHKSIYEITDQIEQKLCLLMEKGRMRQTEAISLIRSVKGDLSEAPSLVKELDNKLK